MVRSVAVVAAVAVVYPAETEGKKLLMDPEAVTSVSSQAEGTCSRIVEEVVSEMNKSLDKDVSAEMLQSFCNKNATGESIVTVHNANGELESKTIATVDEALTELRFHFLNDLEVREECFRSVVQKVVKETAGSDFQAVVDAITMIMKASRNQINGGQPRMECGGGRALEGKA
jgi:hypothetical protein